MGSLKKCLVWDLDNTLWDGVCLEGTVRVKQEVADTVAELDRRGILHSIASRGDAELAMSTLRENRLDGFFLVPQINWQPKSRNLITVSRELKLSFDAIAFIDDDPFERDQVAFMLPSVLTIPAERAPELPSFPEFSPGEITREASQRRQLYSAERDRELARQEFASRKEFLLSCKMQLSIRPMKEEDIPRVLELMTRTHQLNTTGRAWDRATLIDAFHGEPAGLTIMVAELRDRFGWYGIIATAIVETGKPSWRLKYLAVSCRVMGRGIERAFLASMIHSTPGDSTSVEAEFRDTGRNRMMRALYQMMGFRVNGRPDESGMMTFRAKQDRVPDIPRWVEIL
jgi:FkbH-like protein